MSECERFGEAYALGERSIPGRSTNSNLDTSTSRSGHAQESDRSQLAGFSQLTGTVDSELSAGLNGPAPIAAPM